MFAPADTAQFVLSIPAVPNDFKVLAFKGDEAISQLYAIHVELVSDNPNIDLESLLNQPAYLQFGLRGEGIHGLIDDIEVGDSGKRMTRYHLILRPHLYQLQHRHNQRVYQNLTVPQIIAKVLKEHGILADQYRFNIAPKPSLPREYCVQYGETDFEFVQRLCFEDGIHWHHEHRLDNHTLVLSDNQTDFPILAPARYQQGTGLAAEDPVVRHFAVRFSTRTSQVARRDYDLKKPDPRSASSGAKLDPVPSTLRSEAGIEALPVLEDYRYPGRYTTGVVGKQLSQIALEGHRADYQLAKGQADLPSFRSGHLVSLTEHPRSEYNQMWLLASVEHEGRQPQVLEESVTSAPQGDAGFTQGYRNHFTAIPSETFFRPEEPAPKPRLSSQTALVTGPAGEEIWCDEHSRIKIQFHWDREGERNEFSSCWVRVATSWAGEGFGHVVIPRIGMEVLVSFIGGDPEHPVVTGCVPNQHTPVPYPLPANKTRSVFKTRSSLGGNGSNELRIEDKKGAEEIYVHAQRDQNIEVEHDETHWVGRDRTKTIDRHERDHIKRNWSINVDSFKTETINLASLQNVGLAKMMNIGTVYSQNVGLHMNTLVGINQSTQVGRSQSTVIGTSYSLKVADGSVQSEAAPEGEEPAPDASGPGSSIKLDGESITLQVGRSKVVITDAGIYLDGPDIHLVAGNTVNADAPADVHLNSGTAQPAPNLPVDAETTQLKGLDVTDAMPLLIDGSW
ncbi:type VI secretion system tip protein VgrG [Pseudomonas sp. Fl4BN1]|uniref:type VI secretion system Vgr family protein n=1 Tax=Pseudomonas sp. Fl4BN1 TaxID=2697651 RepID=UPI00137752B2|nr:type VI secretion system tip protein VgrG [Pseudomonas sp. Fl4BN1]NBF11761.1 type VI secretion system tip protein VgrG [Pseudomonas sp. Fl4BN1]